MCPTCVNLSGVRCQCNAPVPSRNAHLESVLLSQPRCEPIERGVRTKANQNLLPCAFLHKRLLPQDRTDPVPGGDSSAVALEGRIATVIKQDDKAGIQADTSSGAYADRQQVPNKLVCGVQGAWVVVCLCAPVEQLWDIAPIGIYCVLSYLVAQRAHEIGVRRALGTQMSGVLKMVRSEGLKLAPIGLVTGLLGAFALTRLLSSHLYNLKATGPVIFVAVSLTLAGMALSACYIPARRAAKVDPMVALPYE